MSQFQQARIELGAQLRHLREAAHLSGKDLAERLRWQASKVSRIENARQTATEDDVTAWARAVDAAPEVVEELAEQAGAMLERQDSWRQRHRSGLAAIQEDFRDVEARTTAFRVFEPGVVIGLLQTTEYARSIFTRIKRLYNAPDEVDAAIRVRMQRQEILYDQRKRFRFILPESVLRYRLAPLEVMRGQLDRLLAVTALPNVEFGVVPFEAPLPSALLNGFWIYDRDHVAVPTRTRDLILRDPEDIAFYERAFDEFCEIAAFRQDARAVIVRVLEDFAEQSSDQLPQLLD
ncbi:helix-turn-helix domain-containing protein [Planomonospora venezuelensis]|uniref:Transcriptional regulator with XRE-family HTH domain n=1 Tax=Planomonospora venezuelensis TaxID=1999 RepID=A0A841D8S1_PLAVE|nr:helix-turn-helix transcriptional regulator [Planomonospora venezuelensis]MBB5964884.1 transcriptional regulator with XRE-family HTH domain [Planomonospora venezuelensis]GIN04447.1 transcriptional regulator [Planomonospora venezuelensis]